MMTRRWIVGLMVPCLTAVVGGFVGARLAAADPGGRTRRALTVAGTLTGAGSSAMVTFRFRKGATVQCAPVVMVVPGTGGVFSAEVPMDQAGQVCPDALFDGSDVQVDVVVGGTTVVNGSAVNPVPYARYAEQVGTPDCPVGYERVSSTPGHIVCRNGEDFVVRVGRGPSAFWIDRYEASVWSDERGTTATTLSDGRVVPWGEGTAGDDYPPSFQNNGQYTAALYAVSRPGPSSAFITWFQAQAACRASGKRLPTGEEWLAAARGTPDPSTGEGCITGGSGPRWVGRVPNTCISATGAEDMIGNLREWTNEWYAGVGSALSVAGVATTPPVPAVVPRLINEGIDSWPVEYNGDQTWNVAAYASRGDGAVSGLPAAGVRGGAWADGVAGGVFYLSLTRAPSAQGADIGFRCVIPR